MCPLAAIFVGSRKNVYCSPEHGHLSGIDMAEFCTFIDFVVILDHFMIINIIQHKKNIEHGR